MRLVLLALALCSCSDLEVPNVPVRQEREVRVEPGGAMEAAPAVLRLRVVGALGSAALSDFRLFREPLSAYHVRRLASRDVPATLLEREVPTLSFGDGADLVVAPTRALGDGVYSLAAPDLGVLAELRVDATLVPWLPRLWPPPGDASGSGFSVFCGDALGSVVPEEAGAPFSSAPRRLLPSGGEAMLSAGIYGLFTDDCVSLEPTQPGAPGLPALPPAWAGGVGFEPLPLFTAAGATTPPACEEGELVLGPACAWLDDDRLVLRAAPEPSLWVIEEPERLLGTVAVGSSLVVRGLEPLRDVRFRASAYDRAGARTLVETVLTGANPRSHVVINEVLANPLGEESRGEWIELANDGAEAAELGELELRDAGGAVRLPAARLASGELVLLTAAGFAPDRELDVVPPSGTRVLTLESLGASGLSNAGELLRLVDASGSVVSRFPALAAKQAGVSVARRTPSAPDDAASFGAHASPGASPGAPNELAEP